MELRQLTYFVEAARQGNLTRAAERLRVAQPALSQQIQNLEHELGVKLFNRTGRGVSLTEAGKIFFEGAEKTLAEAKRAKDSAQSFLEVPSGKIIVGALESLVQTRLPRLLVKFGREYPGIKVFIRENTTDPLLEALNKGDIDLALAHAIDKEGYRFPLGVQDRHLYHDELVLAVAKDYPLERKACVSVDELKGESFVSFKQGSGIRSQVFAACMKAGFEPLIRYECASPRILVAEGLGVSILPRLMAESPGPLISVIPLDPPLSRAVSAFFFKGRYLSPATEIFLRFLEKEIQ